MKSIIIVTLVVILAYGKGYLDDGLRARGQSMEMVGAVLRDLDLEARNKALVLKFYTQVFRDRDLTNVDQYIAPHYSQHNPKVPDGKEGFLTWIHNLFPPGTPPNPRTIIERVVAEDDLVWVHSLSNLAQYPDPAFDTAAVDIFRLENGLLVEHFDVVQRIPNYAENQRPMLNTIAQEFNQQCTFSRVIKSTD